MQRLDPIEELFKGRPFDREIIILSVSWYPGLYQVNTVVPAGVALGDQVPVIVNVAGQASPPVTIAIRPDVCHYGRLPACGPVGGQGLGVQGITTIRRAARSAARRATTDVPISSAQV
jgi:hypothetical protein